MRTKRMRKTTAQKRNNEHTNANIHFMPALIPTQMQQHFLCSNQSHAAAIQPNIQPNIQRTLSFTLLT